MGAARVVPTACVLRNAARNAAHSAVSFNFFPPKPKMYTFSGGKPETHSGEIGNWQLCPCEERTSEMCPKETASQSRRVDGTQNGT